MNKSTLTDLKSRARGISLGLYAADLGDLRSVGVRAAEWGCPIAHFDEMDGTFVPGLIGGPGLVAATGDGMLRDVHLMLAQPSRHVAAYVKAGADMITVHAEAPDAAEAIDTIRKAADTAGRPVLAGLGLMPGTSLDEISALTALGPDMVLVLSLDPRVGTAPDISKATARLKQLRTLLPDALLSFDGGVTKATVEQIAAAGPDVIVSGSAVMKADNPARAFETMQTAWLKGQG